MGWERTWAHIVGDMGERGGGVSAQEKSVPTPGAGEGAWYTKGVENGSGLSNGPAVQGVGHKSCAKEINRAQS